jgi:hypothetical protein
VGGVTCITVPVRNEISAHPKPKIFLKFSCMCVFYPEEELTKLKASKVNEPIQEEESGDAMLEQGTQVRSSVPISEESGLCF